MATSQGRRIGLTWQRRLINDLMHFSRKVPVVTCHKEMRLELVAKARRAAPTKIAWTALFTKAFALAAKERPELRRLFMSFPCGHLYEHPESIGMVTVERGDEPEPYPIVARILSPETTSLIEIDAKLRQLKTAPADDVREIRQHRPFAKLPWPIRFPLWWSILNLSGRLHARKIGTFAVSSVASEGVGMLSLVSPTTTSLTFGLLTSDDRLDVRLHFDHRVYDGSPAARALNRVEEILNNEIAGELDAISRIRMVPAA